MSQSTVWTQLSSPNSPAGSVPFVDDDNVTIKTDVLNFKYTQDEPVTTLTGSFKPKQLTVDGGLRECMDDFTAAPATAYTINKPIGKVVISAGQTAVTITDLYCSIGAFIQLQMESNDATLLRVIPTNIANGSFSITGNAAATAAVRVAFRIVNTF